MPAQNPEQDLLQELQAAACGRPLPSEVWRQFEGQVVDALGKQGSQNWPLMAAAICYVQTGANSPVLLAFFKKSETMFMGTELLSPTYGVWGHLLPVAVIHAHAVRVGDAKTAAAALDWLRFFWTLVRACTAPDGSILSIGWRASPWQDAERDSTWLAWVRDFAMGRGTFRWDAAGHRLGLGIGQSPVTAICLAIQLSLVSGLADVGPAFRTLTPLHRLAGDGWLAVYLEANGNGNTPPRMAGLWEPIQGGRVSYLPAGDLTRKRQEFDHGAVTHDGATMTFNSSIYGTSCFGLPSLAFSETVYGTGEQPAAVPWEQLQPAPSAPEPSFTAPPPEGEAPDFAALAAVVAALQVPHAQVALRDHLAEQIGDAPPPEARASLADALTGLGIGEGQSQAVGWHQVIDALRGSAA